MKKFVNRALILTIFVLCLFGLTVLATSAEITGATTQDDTHVASVVIEDVTYYYADFNTAMTEAPSGSTVTVLKSAEMGVIDITDKALTVTGAEKYTLTLNSGSYAFKLLGTESSLTVNNLVVDADYATSNAFMFGAKNGASSGTFAFTLNGVDVKWNGGSGAIYGYHSVKADISLTDCSFEGGTAIINTVIAQARGVAMYLDNVTCVGSVVEVNSGALCGVAVTRAITGATVQDDTHVASITVDEVTYYYADIATAIAQAPSGVTLTVLKDATVSAQSTIAGKTLTVVGVGEPAPVITYTGTSAMLSLGNNVNLTLSNLTVNAASSSNGVIATLGVASKSAANATTVTLTNVTLSAASKTLNFTNTPYVTVNATGVQLLSTTAPTVYAANSGSSVITLNFTDTLIAQDIQISTLTTLFKNVTLADDSTASGRCVARLNNNKVGGEGDYAEYTTGYYSTLAGALADAESGDTVYLTADASAAVAKGVYVDDETAVTNGYLFRIGDAANQVYATTLNNAMSVAASGDTITVLANATLGANFVLGSKTLTIQGASEDIVLTQSGYIQLNGGVVSLTIKNLTINNSSAILDIYTSTDTHSVKLENVTINSSRAADGNILYVSKCKANIEIVDCTVNSTNTNRLVTVSSGGNLTDFKVTNTTLSSVVTVRGENSGVVGSAANPAVLTDLTADKTVFNAYTTTVYANVFGGTFTGQFIYGGDGHNNVLDIKLNPTGDKTTNFNLNTTGGYYGFAYQKPADITKNNVKVSFRNTTITESGTATSLFTVTNGDKANFVIGIGENVDFDGETISNTSYVGVSFATDAIAKTWGYDTVRVGEEGNGIYFTSFTSAYLKAVSGDTLYVMKDITSGNVSSATEGKKVTITSAGDTPVTVTNSGGASSIFFELCSGADVTFTNITFNVTNRFMRSYEGNHTVTFGAGATIITNNSIFFYANGQTSGNNTTENINILAGATIKATAATGSGLFYHNQTKDWDGDGTAESRLMNLNLVIAGTIEMVSGPVYKDHNKNGTHTVYYDATTAKVTQTTASSWFVDVFRSSSSDGMALYAKCTADQTAELAAWAYKHTPAYSMTFSADPTLEWNCTFVYHSQLTPKQANVLNSYGGEIWQLRTVGSVNTTIWLTDKGTVTMKAYNGATITLQGNAYRIRVDGATTLILDGIQLKSPGSIVSVEGASSGKHAVLKLVNGAKLTGTAVSTKSSDSTCALVALNGPFTSIYVDSTSEITQTGTATDYGAELILAYSKWANGIVHIQGKLESTVTSTDKTVALIQTNAYNVTTAGFAFDNATLNPSANATTSYVINSPNGTFTGFVGGSKDFVLPNCNNVTFDFAATEVKIGNVYYTLAHAVNAAQNGDTVILLADLTLSTGLTVTGKTFTLASPEGSTFTLTNASSGYLFTIADGADLTLSNINVATNGGLVTASGDTGSFTLAAGATVTGGATTTPFFNVSSAFTNGVITMESGSKLEVTNTSALQETVSELAADTSVYLFNIAAAMSKIEINGQIIVGTSSNVLTIPAATKIYKYFLFSVASSSLQTLNLGGDIDVYTSGKTYLIYTQNSALSITFTGTVDYHVSDYSGMIQMLYGYFKKITVNGATINMTHEGATGSTNSNYSGIFYVTNVGTIDILGGTISAGATGQGFPIVYSGQSTTTITIAGNSVLKQNGTVTAPYILRDGTSNIIIQSNANGIPVIQGASTHTLSSSKGTITVNGAAVIAGGTGWGSATTVTVADVSELYFTSDALALKYEAYVVRLNDEVLGGESEYKDAKTGYYEDFATLWALIGDGDTATIYFLAKVTVSTLTIDNKTVTFVGKDSTVSDMSATSSTNADLYVSYTKGYVVTLKNNAHVTFQNMAVFATRPLFQVSSPGVADATVSMTLINSALSGGAASSVFLTSAGAYESFTLNVDKDSKIMFAPNSSSVSTMFNIGFGASTEITFNIDGALEVTDRYTKAKETDPEYRKIRIIYADVAAPIAFNVSETASISFTCNETQAKAPHSIIEAGANTTNLTATIAAAAITDENGASTLGDMYLYWTINVPKFFITAPDATLDATVAALLAYSPEHTPMNVRAVIEGVHYYYNSLVNAVNDIPDGGERTLYVVDTLAISSEVVINNKSITFAGTAIANDYHLTTTASYAFRFDNLGALTFRDMKISATQGLIRYQAVASDIAKADRDITITFENTTVDANGAASSLISSVEHHGNVDNKKCDSVTVTIDEDSVINFTTSTTDTVKVIRYDHNTHGSVYTNIHGTVNVKVTGDSDTSTFYFIRSNNPGVNEITVSQTADINISLPEGRVASGESYFTSNTAGSTSTNLIYLHADAITQDGELTLGGVVFYSEYYGNRLFTVVIEANDTSATAAFAAWQAHKAVGGTPVTINPIVMYAMADGVYYYVSHMSSAKERVEAAQSTCGLHFLADVTVDTGFLFDNVTAGVSAAEGVTVTSSAARLFTLTNGAKLTVDEMTIVITAESADVATTGGLIAVADEAATAKVTVALNDLTVTGSSSVLFYFGGESEAEVTITGGAYSAQGIFSIGAYRSNVDVASNAKVDLTVTGTEADHVTLTSSSREIILIKNSKAASENKDDVNITFHYVDATATGADAVYMRGSATLTYTHNYGSVTASNNMLLTSQANCVPKFTYNNVTLTRSNNSYVLRPYGGSGYGAYVTLNSCVIEAPAVTGSVFGASSDVDVTLTGCTINAAKAATVFGSASNSEALIYTADGCTFNIGAGATIGASPYRVIVKGATKILVDEALVTFTAEMAEARGLAFVVDGAVYYTAELFATALDNVPDGGTATVRFLARVKSGLITINNKNITFVGRDATVNDLTYASNANADLYFSSDSGYFITLQDKATVTFRNIAVHANRPLFMYGNTSRDDLEKADRDITLNFENAWVSGGSASSVFMGGSGSSGTCDAFTINVDANSKLLFAPNSTSDSTMFIANYTTFASFTVNLDGAIEITDMCTSKARQIWMFNADSAVPLRFTASDTASIVFTCDETQAAAHHTIVDQSDNVEMTIAAAAITDNSGNSTLGDMYLYLSGSASAVPTICITHTSNALEATLRALLASKNSVEEKPIQYLVVTGDVYYYFNSLTAATEFATANGTTVQNLKEGAYADAAAAVAGGMIYRLGAAVANGVYGEHYFDKLSELMAYATEQGATDITVYVLTSDKGDTSSVTLTGIKLTLDSVDSTKQTVKLSAAPVFTLDNNSHLVIKNVKILISSGFVCVTATGEANTAKLDLEAKAEIEAFNFSGGYFLRSYSTALLTVNLKQGSSIKMLTNGTVTDARQGMFDFSGTTSSNSVAEGSSITIDGTVIYGLTFNASKSANSRRAAMFKVGDKTLDLFFTEHADVQLLHVNAYAGTWNNIVCLDSSSADTVITFNGGKYTTNENCGLLGLNGAGYSGTYEVTGSVDVSGVSDALIYDYAEVNNGNDGTVRGDNTTVILFKDVDLGSATVAKNGKLACVVLDNVAFASDAHAAANYGMKVDGLENYYSLNKAVELAADGATITLLGNVIGANAVIENKTLTVQSADAANPFLITNGGMGATYIFKCVGNSHLTLKNLQINAKGHAITFVRGSHVEIVDNGDGTTTEKTVTDNVTSSSLNIINTDIYGIAAYSAQNAMINVGNGSGHHNFDLHIDANSSVGYVDGDPAEILSTRNYQVIFYYASVTGDILIEGDVFAYVYFNGSQVNYEKVQSSSTKFGPNQQYMIMLGNSSSHTFIGNFVVTGSLTHKVVFPDTDENGDPVYAEDYPTRHRAYAIRVYGANASVFVAADSATITIDYTNEYEPNSDKIGFDAPYQTYTTTYNSTAGKLYYNGAGALLGFLTWNGGSKITVATGSGSNYGIVYDNTTYVTSEKDAGGYDYFGATEIAALLSELTGATITATDDKTTTTKEIIIGIANRDVVQQYRPEIAMNEYAIILTSNKILVLAWHDGALDKAIASFKYALKAGTNGTTVYLPNVTGVFTAVADKNWVDDFTKPTTGTLWGGQYVDSNSLQYVYSGYANTAAGQAAFMAYCSTLVAEGYTLVWQNVIENNLFRMYQNTTTGLALYVAYNDYAYKDEFIAKYAQEESDLAEEFEPSWLEQLGGATVPSFDDSYFENRDHQKVLRVISMPLSSVTMPDEGINTPDFSYNKVTNTLQTTLSFQSTSVGMGHVYMLEDGRFLVIDGGGYGYTSEGDYTESEAIYQVMLKMYQNVYGYAPTEQQPIHIAAWYLTHTHWDHFTAFNKFAATYGADIILDYVIANVPVQQSVYKNAEVQFPVSSITALIANFKGGSGKYLKVCTGQKLYLANLEIEVLMTFMDHAPFDIINTNDTNTVTRFTINNKEALNGQTAQVLYLGDSWRHSSRILCEMYGDYLQTEIVQLAHHGNIGCERILYKTIAPRAVYFSHNAGRNSENNKMGMTSYLYWSNLSSANATAANAFRYAADIWCAQNAEYVWSAPYGTYNMLEFGLARPDYEGIYELGIQPGKTAGTRISADTSVYGAYTDHDQSNEYVYIYNPSKGYKSVNIVWGDLSFTYQDDGSTPGTWSPETHTYEGATDATREPGWVANGDNRIFVGNASTGNSQNVTVEMSYTAASGYTNFTGSFTDNGTATLGSKQYKMFTFNLGTSALPATDITDQVVGSITVTLK